MTSRLGLVCREDIIITARPDPAKALFNKGVSLAWARNFVVNWNIRNILGYNERGHISLRDNVTQMKIYWQIKKKWEVLLKITAKTSPIHSTLLEMSSFLARSNVWEYAKTCITLRRLPLVLPTSVPIPCVLGCGLTSNFRDLKILIMDEQTTGLTQWLPKC